MNKRIEFIDWAKFIGLFLVIFAHIPPTRNTLHIIIYSFHMPLFFFLGGIFFRKDGINIGKLAKSLLVPYFSLSVILIFINEFVSSIIGQEFQFRRLQQQFIGILLGTSDPDAPICTIGRASWFLVAYFLVRINAWLIMRYKVYTQIIVMILEVYIISILKQFLLWFPFSIDAAVYGSTFYVMGYYSRNFIFNMSNIAAHTRILAIAVCSILAYLSPMNGLVNMYEGNYGSSFFLFCFFGLSGTLLVVALSSMLVRMFSFVSVIVRGATFIICTHLFILEYIYLVYRRVFYSQINSPVPFVFGEKLLFSFIVMVIFFYIIRVVNKYVPSLLGK